MAYLESVLPAEITNVLPAKASAGKTLDNTIVWSEKFEEEGVNSAVYNLEVSVMCKSKVLNPAAVLTSDARVANVFDAFKMDYDSGSDKLAADITAAARAAATADPVNNGDLADYTCQAVIWNGGECGFDEESKDVWLDTLMLKVVACPSNVS